MGGGGNRKNKLSKNTFRIFGLFVRLTNKGMIWEKEDGQESIKK